MTTITLYGPAQAPFVIKVRGALALKKLEYDFVQPAGPEDYRRWSPETGLLPVIDVGGTRVQDSARILDHLDERFPEPPLVSGDKKVADSQRRLERWVEEMFMFYWVNHLRALVQREGLPGDEGAVAEARRSLRRMRRRATAERSGSPGLAAEFSDRLDDLVNFLGSRDFFYADRISRADLAVYSFVRNIPSVGGSELAGVVEGRPALRHHLLRVEALTGALGGSL